MAREEWHLRLTSNCHPTNTLEYTDKRRMGGTLVGVTHEPQSLKVIQSLGLLPEEPGPLFFRSNRINWYLYLSRVRLYSVGYFLLRTLAKDLVVGRTLPVWIPLSLSWVSGSFLIPGTPSSAYQQCFVRVPPAVASIPLILPGVSAEIFLIPVGITLRLCFSRFQND